MKNKKRNQIMAWNLCWIWEISIAADSKWERVIQIKSKDIGVRTTSSEEEWNDLDLWLECKEEYAFC